MAREKSRFFDSIEMDRTYSAEQFAEYFRSFFSTGVFDTGDNLQVIADGIDMNIKVHYGIALIEGYGYWLEDDGRGPYTFALTAGNQPRIDRVVLRLDKRLTEREIHLALIKGEESAQPVAPLLTRTGIVYEVSLAQVYVPAHTIAITDAQITDERESQDVCGVVELLLKKGNQGPKGDSGVYYGTTPGETDTVWIDPSAGGTVSVKDELPIGTIITLSNSNQLDTDCMLICDGSYYSKDTYADLYQAIGDTYGSTSTTFRVPDMRNKFVMGNLTAGMTGGASTKTLTTEHLPSHTHGIALHSSSTGAHTHSVMTRIQHGDGTIVSGEYLSGCSLAAGSARKRYSNDCGSAGNHTHAINGDTMSAGTGTAFSILPPYITQFYAIKYAYKTRKSSAPILKIRDQSNNWIEIPAIKGSDGVDGTSAVGGNLLINSNFLRPVNQRGATSYISRTSALKYTIDRWALMDTSNQHLSIVNDGITVSDAIVQYVEAADDVLGKNFTCSAEDASGHIRTLTVKTLSGSSAYNDYFALSYEASLGAIRFYLKAGTWKWAKLEYGTVATTYVPNLYAVEELLCKRYMVRFSNCLKQATGYWNQSLQFVYTFPTPMRVKPTPHYDLTHGTYVSNQNGNMDTGWSITGITGSLGDEEQMSINLQINATLTSKNYNFVIMGDGDYLEFDAEIY